MFYCFVDLVCNLSAFQIPQTSRKPNLNYQFTILTWVLLAAAIAGLYVVVVVWKRRKVQSNIYLVFLELAAAVWSFTAIFELAATTIPLKLLWSQVSYLGIASVPLFYFLYALAFGQYSRYITKRNVLTLSCIPVVTILAVVTNNQHGLFYSDISINMNNFGMYEHNIFFWIYIAYAYLLLLFGIVIFTRTIIRSNRFFTPRILLVLFGTVMPLVGNIMYVFELNPIPGLDWTPIAFVFSGIILGWGNYRFKMFDLTPLARNQLVETMKDGVLVIDEQAQVVDLNPAMQSIIGMPISQIIGQPTEVLLSQWTDLHDHLKTDYTGQIEVQSGAGQSLRYLQLYISSLHDRHDQFTGQLIMLRDITDRKQADQVLRETETKYSELFQSMSNGVAIYEPVNNGGNFIIKDLNAAGEKLTKVKIAEIRGKLATEAFPGLKEFGMLAVFKQVLDSGQAQHYPTKLYSDSKLESWFENYIYKLPSGDIVAIFNDITQKKLVENQLKESEQQFRLVWDKSPLGMRITDLAGIVIKVNQVYADMVEMDIDQIEGHSLAVVYSSELRENIIRKHQQRVKDRSIEAFMEREITFWNGKNIWLAVSNSYINYQGQEFILGIFNDYTQRKLGEDQLQEANSIKELLLDIITHDLKNPAGVIRGFAEIALEDGADQDILENIHQSSDSLLKVIENASVLSKVTIGDEIAKEQINLRDLIQSIEKEFAPSLDYAGMSLESNISEGLEITANPIIAEVFKNYLSNAIKHAKSGKRIIIESKLLDDCMCVHVIDFGQPIPEAEYDHIFFRKYQLKSERGMGLGLAIVKRIAEAHNAQVGVKPNQPTGNIFYIKFPRG